MLSQSPPSSTMKGPVQKLLSQSAPICGVKTIGSGYRLGSKLMYQSKMKPLSDPQLSQTSMVQVPFSGQPSRRVQGWAAS